MTFAQFSGSGNGTEDDPYLIFNENQLAQVSNFLNQEGVVFKLMKDLDLTDWIAENNPKQGWIPIGVESSPFKGVFNGNKHKITGLSIKRATENNVGFFGYTLDATIQDLTIEGAYIIGNDYVGGLAGQLTSSTIANVTVKFTHNDGIAGNDNIGGFLGKSISSRFTVCNVVVTGKKGVSGSSCVGGFAGYSQNDYFEDFSVSSAINAVDYAGGIAGIMNDGYCNNGSFSGTISVTNGSGGGFAAEANGYEVINVTTTGNISAVGEGCQVGGMVAIGLGVGKLKNYTSIGDLSAKNVEGNENGALGGIIGFIKGGSSVTLESCFSKGKLTNTGNYTGGIIGESEGACIAGMENCSHFGDIKGQNYVGGLVGAIVSVDVQPHLYTYEVWSDNKWEGDDQMPYGTLYQRIKETIENGSKMTIPINNCTSIGNIDGNDWVGGLIGSDLSSYGYSPKGRDVSYGNMNERSYLKCLFKDDIYVTCTWQKLSYTVCDYLRNSVSSSLTNNYYSGTIQGDNCVGGLVGLKGGGELKNNYSYSTVFGSKDVGGIVGSTAAQSFDNAYLITTIKSNVANCQIISATNSNLGRIYGSIAEDEYTVIGALGSAEGNRALAQTKLVLQGVVQEEDDNLQQGTSIGPSALKLKANYVSWGWNFDENWNILETESYPYKKYQAAPPVIESNLVSQNMGISGKSLNGGTVYLYYKDKDVVSTVCNGNKWSFATEALQSGAQVKVYADAEGMTPSYFTTTFVGYPGSGTEADPWRIYTAEDLQGASNRGYYKLMNDVDLTSWINENSPTEGWPAIGRNSGEITYIDGDNHKVTGLWINTNESFNGLFSNFSAGQIKNLTVEVASGKKVKGGDYTGILIGRNANGSLINCTVKGDVEGGAHTGGVAGYVENSTLQNLSFSGSVSSDADNAFIGGLIGQTLDCELTASEAYSKITATGNGDENTFMKIGGLVGESKGGTIRKSITQNNMTATGENCYAGGLVGYSETPITLSISEGTVTASGDNTYSGGLVGYALAEIDNSFSTANTTGTQFSAGLVGYTFNSIDKCYAKGDVYGYMWGGGVVGKLEGSNAKLTNSVACCNILSLAAQSSYGCRVIGGYMKAPDPDESNYALSTMQVSLNGVPKKTTDDILEGKAMTQAMLMKQSTYEQLGWDFTETWSIVEGENYPLLQSNGLNSDDKQNEEPDEPIPSNVDVITVADLTLSSGDGSTIVVSLENETTDFAAYQIDITLPAGINLAKGSNGSYLVSSTERYDENAQLGVNLIEDNTYRIVLYSNSNSVITGNKGAILNIPINVAERLVDGEYEVKFTNIIFTKVGGTQLKLNDTTSKVIISNLKKGDANGDGEINVADVMEIVKDILHKTTSRFVREAADVNEDGEINVTDIVLVVNMIMGGNTNMARGMSQDSNNDVLSLYENGNHSFSLALENRGGYVASQFDLVLSKGQTLEGIFLNGSRCNGHMLAYTKTGDNQYKVVVYSLDNQPYNQNEGELLSIKTSGNENIEIDNILFVTETKAEKRFSSLHSETLGINVVESAQPVDIYGIDGRLVRSQAESTNGLTKGVYIINGKKHVVR
jgi:hypothetical protein